MDIMNEIAEFVQQCNENYANGAYDVCIENLENLRLFGFGVNTSVVDLNKCVANFAKSQWYAVDDFNHSIEPLISSNESRGIGQEYLLYNQAVVAFHSGYYVKTSQLINCIFELGNVSENVRMYSVLLLSEVYLLLRQPEKVLKLLTQCDHFLSEKDKPSSNNPETKAFVDSIKRRTCFIKSRLSLISRNYKLYQKEVKKLPSSWLSTLIRAQFDYQRLSPQKSLKTLMNLKEQIVGRESYASSGVSCSTLQLNAIGCSYFQMNKYNLSLVLFQKAIAEYTNAINSLPRNSEGQLAVPLYCQSSVNRLYLLQNYGVALLHTKQPAAAFDCLIEVVKIVSNNCRLWLRLAECCIMANKPNNEVDFEMQRRKRHIVQEIVGVGPHRKIILNTNLHGRKQNLNNEQGALPTLSLEFAHVCLKNALSTLPVLDTEILNSLTDTAANETPSSAAAAAAEPCQTFPTPFSNMLTVKEVYRLKCSILCATSYVCLCLGENQLALEAAKSLLSQNFLSTIHRLLANLYAAEASILSERYAEALNFLKVNVPRIDITDKELIIPELWNGRDPTVHTWFPSTVSSFKTVLYYNMAVCYALQEEFEKANQTVSSIGDVDLPIQVTMLRLYIQLHLGQYEAARYAVMKMLPQLQSPMSFG